MPRNLEGGQSLGLSVLRSWPGARKRSSSRSSCLGPEKASKQRKLRRQSLEQCSSSPVSHGLRFAGLSDFLLTSLEVLSSPEVNATPNQGLQQTQTFFPKFQELLGYRAETRYRADLHREEKTFSSANPTIFNYHPPGAERCDGREGPGGCTVLWVPVWLYLFGVGKSQLCLCVLHH